MPILDMSLSAGVMIALLLLMRKHLLRHTPAKLLPWLWAPALLRMLLPGSLSLLPAQPLAGTWTPAGAVPVMVSDAFAGPQPAYQPMAAEAVSRTDVLPWLWLLGLLLCLVYLLAHRLGWHNRLRYAIPCDSARLAAWQQLAPMRRAVRVFTVDTIDSPFTTGILRPRIYLPAALDDAHLLHVLLHEGTHIRRFHAAIKALALAAACLHWFNPLAWALVYWLGRDLEMACDARTVASLPQEGRAAYAHTLITLATASTLPSPSAAFAQHPITERIQAMCKPKTSRRVAACLLLMLLLSSLGMFAASATSGLPETVDCVRVTWLSDSEFGRAGETQTTLSPLAISEGQLAGLVQGQLPLYLPGSEDYTLVEDSLNISLPGNVDAPDRAPDATEETEQQRTEIWHLPAETLTETFSVVSALYETADGDIITYEIFLEPMEDAFGEGNPTINWIGTLDNGLVLVMETGALVAVPEDAYLTYAEGQPGNATQIHKLVSGSLTPEEMLPLLKSALPLSS